MMVRMISTRLDGQMSLCARCDDVGWVHWGMGRVAVGRDCLPKVVTAICGDGCADFGIVQCHWGVDILVICGDDVGVADHSSVGLLKRSSSGGNLADVALVVPIFAGLMYSPRMS